MLTLRSTPREDGFRMPAEFEPHVGCWMTWPERPDVWRENAAPAQRDFVAVASAIARFEPVTVCASRDQWEKARSALPSQVRVIELSSNDAWMRDHAPLFVIDDGGQMRGVDFIFNGYGGPEFGAYWPCDFDDQIASKILEIERRDRYRCEMVLEGGSIHIDGEGTLITTEECLLNSNRNPQLTRWQIEANLREFLGVEKIVWLSMGVHGDGDNSGHIDDLCCFVRPGVVVLTWTDDPEDPQYARSRDAFQVLSREHDARGRPFEIHKLYQPNPVYFSKKEVEGILKTSHALHRQAGQRVGASYVNFYIANGGILVPGFDDPHDEGAVATLQALFPDRDVVQIQTHEILLGVGNIHCIVMQQPRPHPY